MINAAMGLLAGEWYMFLGSGGGALQRGSIYLPSDWNLLNENEFCVALPWASLLQRAQEMGADFNFDYTINNAPSYQVSVWYDTAFEDEDDFMDGGLIFNLSDFLPNTIGTKARAEYNPYDPCLHNLGGYGDVNVDANDVSSFLSEFGRTFYWHKCPNCEN